jgi:hypothetical protein
MFDEFLRLVNEQFVWIFFLISFGRVRLSPTGASATNWPIVPAPDDRCC